MIIIFLIVFVIIFLIVQVLYWITSYFNSIYLSMRLTWGDKHDYFFKLTERLLSKRDVVVSFGGNIITIADNNGVTYFIDVDLIDAKFNMKMKSMFVECFIFGEDLNESDNTKFNRLIDLCKIKENQRKFLNNFEIESYKK